MLSISKALFWGARSVPRNLSRTGHIANYHGKNPSTENAKIHQPSLSERLEQIAKLRKRGQLRDAMDLCKTTITDYPKDERAYQHLVEQWGETHKLKLLGPEMEWLIDMYEKHISPIQSENKGSDKEIKPQATTSPRYKP